MARSAAWSRSSPTSSAPLRWAQATVERTARTGPDGGGQAGGGGGGGAATGGGRAPDPIYGDEEPF